MAKFVNRMTPAIKNHALDMLQASHTLADAETLLGKLRPILTTPMKWGLFDGYKGRPRTTAGLVHGLEMKDGPESLDYNEGCEIGRELSMRGLPS